jgi:hypothetical protein
MRGFMTGMLGVVYMATLIGLVWCILWGLSLDRQIEYKMDEIQTLRRQVHYLEMSSRPNKVLEE